ncbi:hypothetical protein ME804_17620 [Lactobacillus delbrueckii]|jgi:hypothetical protein|nr:hypothetical protein ME804_17620 [Lactobacillus delbrueckii]
MNNKGTVNLMSGKGLILKIVEKGDKKIFDANFPGFYNSMSKKPTITAFFEV